ncbi:MAG TPA: hypothetical protein V6D06_14565 [Trichocoleus sp.]
MPRDNERIIQICTELSQTSRKALTELLEAGAPTDLIVELLHGFRGLENVVGNLAQPQPRHGEIIPWDSQEVVIRRAAEEALKPFLQRLDAIADKVDAFSEKLNDPKAGE